MSPQYRILSGLLQLLKTANFACTRLSRVECLIYRLKLILLTCDGCGVAALDRLCPTAVLEELRRMVTETDSSEAAGAVVQRVETELALIIQQLERALPAIAANEAEGQRLRSRAKAGIEAEI